MVKAKTGITILKRLGIVLIALPEPFTTPIGVACVIASGYLARLREATLNKHLRETLTRYLSHTKRSNDETDNKSHARQKVKPYTRTDNPTILWQNTSHIEANHITPIRRNRRNAEEKTIHHNIDEESLARHYPVTDASKVKIESSHSDVAPVKTEKLIHHSVDKQFLSRRYPATDGSKAKTASSHSDVAPEETEKMIHHSIDMQMLGRRYKTHESYKGASLPADESDAAENVVHHTIHAVSLSRRWESNDNARTNSKVNCTPDADETFVHHSINLKSLSQRYGQLAPAR